MVEPTFICDAVNASRVHTALFNGDLLFRELSGRLDGTELLARYIELNLGYLARTEPDQGLMIGLYQKRINDAQGLLNFRRKLDPTDAEPRVVHAADGSSAIHVGGGAGSGGYSIRLGEGENVVDYGSS